MENKAPIKIFLPKGNYDYLCNNGKFTGCYTEKGHETEVCFILESEHNRIIEELKKMYIECLDEFCDEKRRDEANLFLSTYGSELSKELAKKL
jgi:hypothetical protein